jgi:transcription elongation factor GreA
VRQIREMLENAEIIQADDDDVVKPGKLVTIKRDGDDELEVYFLGLREEKGGEHDVLTPDSPLGQALQGHSTGQSVVAETPAGPKKIEIVAVEAP